MPTLVRTHLPTQVRLAAAAQLQQRGWAASTGGEKQVSDWMRNCLMLDMLTEGTWPTLPPVLRQLAAEVDELRAELAQATLPRAL